MVVFEIRIRMVARKAAHTVVVDKVVVQAGRTAVDKVVVQVERMAVVDRIAVQAERTAVDKVA